MNRATELANQLRRNALEMALYADKLSDVAGRSPVRAARCIAQLDTIATLAAQRIDELQNLQYPGEME